MDIDISRIAVYDPKSDGWDFKRYEALGAKAAEQQDLGVVLSVWNGFLQKVRASDVEASQSELETIAREHNAIPFAIKRPMAYNPFIIRPALAATTNL